MIFVVVAAYLCGSSFYKTAKRHHKSGMLYGLLGTLAFAIIYWASMYVFQLLEYNDTLPFNALLINIASIIVSAIVCYFALIFTDKYMNSSQRNNILDDNL